MVTLVGEYVKLTKRGSNHVGLCPFHAEKTGSFNVSAANKFFHCFGCKESGDCFSFVMRMEGVGFPQAARVLAERLGVEIPDQDRAEDAAERRARARREGQLALMDGRAASTNVSSPSTPRRTSRAQSSTSAASAPTPRRASGSATPRTRGTRWPRTSRARTAS
jgi:DNA primase